MRKSAGKHSKFIPLNTSDIAEEKIILPGRRVCNCEASRHELINNCLRCGRIVCKQEGSGPCFTCGHLVCTPKEEEIILRQNKKSFKLYQDLMNQEYESNDFNEDSKLQLALQHRDKLLEYDRTVEKRTKVIDDENDYFQVNSKWLSSEKKKLLDKKKEEMYEIMHNRRKQTFTFDFAGRKIVDEKPTIKLDEEELMRPDTSIFECQNSNELDIPLAIQPKFVDVMSSKRIIPYENEDNKRLHFRIQDKELQEMSDEGMCLSLHQPYASLIVAGIKKHEGRVWYTSYRGRLWIHSTSKVPSTEEIKEVENTYRAIQDNCNFPEKYPPGCLLGCADLLDCLPQDEYKNQFPTGPMASPYVFIFENPQELTIKFPMKGKHKIYKLESNLHHAAKKMLTRQIH